MRRTISSFSPAHAFASQYGPLAHTNLTSEPPSQPDFCQHVPKHIVANASKDLTADRSNLDAAVCKPTQSLNAESGDVY